MARGKMAARAEKARDYLKQAKDIERYEKQISDRDAEILRLKAELEQVKDHAQRTQDRLHADVLANSSERVRELEQRLREAADRAITLKNAGMLLASRYGTFTGRTMKAWLQPEGIVGDILLDAVLLLAGEPGRIIADNNHSGDPRLNEIRRIQNVGKTRSDKGEAFMDRLRSMFPDPVKHHGEIMPGQHISEVDWWKKQ